MCRSVHISGLNIESNSHLHVYIHTYRKIVAILTAVLTPAALRGSVAVVTQFAVLTAVALSVVQAFETGACPGVTGRRVVHVDVVATLAGHAAPTGHQRVPEVTGSALVTPDT